MGVDLITSCAWSIEGVCAQSSTRSNCISRFSQAMPYHVRENPNWSSRKIIGRKSRVKEEIWLRGINWSSWCEYDWHVSVRYCFRSVANRAYRSILYNARFSPWLKREKRKNVYCMCLLINPGLECASACAFSFLTVSWRLFRGFDVGFCAAFLFFRRLSLHTESKK